MFLVDGWFSRRFDRSEEGCEPKRAPNPLRISGSGSSGKLIPACTVPASARPNCRIPLRSPRTSSTIPIKTAGFYRHPLRDLESFRAAAREIQFSGERRAALVAALRRQNADSPALERLAQPGTVVVATGQQVGLFSGPAYTIYKALHAARLAEWLTANGIPAVPVFWVATEDHDFAEVNHAWVFDAAHRPVKLEMRRSASAQPVGTVTLVSPPVNELRSALHGMPFGEEVADLVEETYRGGNTMGGAFGELIRKLLARFDIPQLDPMLPEFRALAAPALRAAVESHAGAHRSACWRAIGNCWPRGTTRRSTWKSRPRSSSCWRTANAWRCGARARIWTEWPPVLHRGSGRSRGLAFAQCAAAAGGAGFHPAHRGLHHGPGGSGLPGAIRGALPHPSWGACRWWCRAPASPSSTSTARS